MADHSTLPDIQNCIHDIVGCRFKFDPNYSSIFGFFYMIVLIFVVLPYFIGCWNFIFFEKIVLGKTAHQLLCPKKSLLQSLSGGRKKKVNFAKSRKVPESKFNHHIAYKLVDNQYLIPKIERSKINQVAPIINTETDEGEPSKILLMSENQEHSKSANSHRS